MDECLFCGTEDADCVCEGCRELFCKNCIRGGLCPTCRGETSLDDTVEISVEDL
jgi:hypothetical protein